MDFLPSDAVAPVAKPHPDSYSARLAVRRHDLRRQLDAIFTGPETFTWELGCGHGHFLAAYAAAHPAEKCVGIDIMSDRIGRADRKRERSRLPNLFFVRADARLFLEALPPEICFSELFVLFPDPWPKARHHKHRIIQSDFLDEAAKRATSGCRLSFRTDYKPYYDDARAILDAHGAWQLREESWRFEFETVFQSRAAEHYSLVARRRSLSGTP